MDIVFKVFVVVCLVACAIHHVTSLQCYACADSGVDNECERYDTYVEAVDGKRPKVLKNCSDSYDKVCFIETYASNGQEVSHIRDCGDGETFSFSVSENTSSTSVVHYDRLDNLGVNNETACVFTGQYIICLTKCNTTFCNGPSIDEINRAVSFKLEFSFCLSILFSILIAVSLSDFA